MEFSANKYNSKIENPKIRKYRIKSNGYINNNKYIPQSIKSILISDGYICENDNNKEEEDKVYDIIHQDDKNIIIILNYAIYEFAELYNSYFKTNFIIKFKIREKEKSNYYNNLLLNYGKYNFSLFWKNIEKKYDKKNKYKLFPKNDEKKIGYLYIVNNSFEIDKYIDSQTRNANLQEFQSNIVNDLIKLPIEKKRQFFIFLKKCINNKYFEEMHNKKILEDKKIKENNKINEKELKKEKKTNQELNIIYQKQEEYIKKLENEKNELHENNKKLNNEKKTYLDLSSKYQKQVEYIKKLENESNDLRKIIQPAPIPPPKPAPFLNLPDYPTKIGLGNIGSTCYMNATLQCFSQTACMTNYFLDPKNKELIEKGKFKSNNNLRLAKEYYEVIYNLWGKKGNIKYYEPRQFKKVLGILNEAFKKMEASDAKDLIIFFLERIHQEINLVLKNKEQKEQKYDQYNQQSALNYFGQNFINENKSFISDTFFIVYQSTQQCQNCVKINSPYHTSYNYQILNNIIFPLNEVSKFKIQQDIKNMNMFQMNIQNRNINLYDCFEYYRKVEFMSGNNQIFCNNCRQLSDSLYQTQLMTLPNIIILILDRGKNNMYKIDIDIFPEIDLTNYILFPQNERHIYSLYGVITHKGPSGESGHFIASCKFYKNNKWYLYNDAFVNDIQDKDFFKKVIQEPIPYILFYERKL